MLDANRSLVPSWALPAWDAATHKGIVQADTKPQDVMTKAEFMVFLDRMGVLK